MLNRVEKVIVQSRHLTKDLDMAVWTVFQIHATSCFHLIQMYLYSHRLLALTITTSFLHMPVTNGIGVFWSVCQFVDHFCLGRTFDFVERFLLKEKTNYLLVTEHITCPWFLIKYYQIKPLSLKWHVENNYYLVYKRKKIG